MSTPCQQYQYLISHIQPEAHRLYIQARMCIPPTRSDSRPTCAPCGGGGIKKILVGVVAQTLSRARHPCCRGGSRLFVFSRIEPVCSFHFIHFVLAVSGRQLEMNRMERAQVRTNLLSIPITEIRWFLPDCEQIV